VKGDETSSSIMAACRCVLANASILIADVMAAGLIGQLRNDSKFELFSISGMTMSFLFPCKSDRFSFSQCDILACWMESDLARSLSCGNRPSEKSHRDYWTNLEFRCSVPSLRFFSRPHRHSFKYTLTAYTTLYILESYESTEEYRATRGSRHILYADSCFSSRVLVTATHLMSLRMAAGLS